MTPMSVQIRVRGHLDASWNDWFDGLTIINQESAESTLVGRLPDQTALHGVLTRISSLGLILISMNAGTAED
jgi:hypothetical protein